MHQYGWCSSGFEFSGYITSFFLPDTKFQVVKGSKAFITAANQKSNLQRLGVGLDVTVELEQKYLLTTLVFDVIHYGQI